MVAMLTSESGLATCHGNTQFSEAYLKTMITSFMSFHLININNN